MDFFIHFMQQIADYYANTANPTLPSKTLLSRTKLFVNLLLYAIFVNVPIIFPGIFILILTKDHKILPLYSLFGISLLILILITEVWTFWRIWGMFSKNEFESLFQDQSEDDARYKISLSLIFVATGLIPLIHVIFCPLAIIYAAEGMELIDRNKFNPKYKLAAKNFIVVGAIIYVVYSTIILFAILVKGNAEALRS